jgi:hypothetical protein
MLLLATMPALTQDKKDDKKDDKSPESTAKADIKWKFEKGKTFYQQLTTETTQDLKVMGQDVKQKQSQTFYFSWTPIDMKDDSWVLEQEIKGVKVDIDIGGNKIAYDSANPGSTNTPLGEFFKALIGTKFKLTLDKDLKVTKVEGGKEFLDKLVSANQQMKPLLESILSDDALKQMADPTFRIAANKEVAPKDEWKYTSTLALGPIGKYETVYTYTYDGKEKDKEGKELAKISIKPKLTYTPPDAATPQGLPFKIKSAKLETKEASGSALFDDKAGRVDSSNISLKLEGTLEIEINGQSTTVDLKQTQTSTMKTSSEPQIKK